MDVVTIHTAQAAGSEATWSLSCDIKQLRATLHRASKSAAHKGAGILASFIQPINWFDSIRIFTGSQRIALDDRFYWERPDEQIVMLGLGTTVSIETSQQTRFAEAASIWQALIQDAVITDTAETYAGQPAGPLLCGGFAFDIHASHTALWEGFSEGSLKVPHLIFGHTGQQSTLTINWLVQATDEIEQLVHETLVTLTQLRSAVEQVDSQPQLKTSGILYQRTEQDLQSAPEWMELVARSVQQIRQGAYKKVMLARGIRVETSNQDEVFQVGDVLTRLRQHYPEAYLFAIQRGERYFVGATPERLVDARNGRISTMALAGTAARGASPTEDRQIGIDLLHSLKNSSEHRLVVEMINQALQTFCTNVQVASAPRLLKLKNVQHLETDISGELRPGHSILEIVASLHPTPAVGGVPLQEAMEVIRTGEKLDRGWYAGPVGWLDARGNGEFAVALRSGLLENAQATLFAGCGIVAGSDPDSEYTESCLKLQVMLRGLGGED